jgi:hypothetical protein
VYKNIISEDQAGFKANKFCDYNISGVGDWDNRNNGERKNIYILLLDSIQDAILYNWEKYFIGKEHKEIIGDVYYAHNVVRRSGNLIHLQGKGYWF